MTTADETVKNLVCGLFEFGEDKWFDYQDEFERFYAIAYKAGMERAAEIADNIGDKDNGFGAAHAIREEAKK